MHNVWTSEQGREGGGNGERKGEEKRLRESGLPPSSPQIWHLSLLRGDPLLPRASPDSLPSSALFRGTLGHAVPGV